MSELLGVAMWLETQPNDISAVPEDGAQIGCHEHLVCKTGQEAGPAAFGGSQGLDEEQSQLRVLAEARSLAGRASLRLVSGPARLRGRLTWAGKDGAVPLPREDSGAL